MEPLRVLIADDHPVFRNGMRALLNSVPDMEVVGEASTGAEVMELAASLQPDVILRGYVLKGAGPAEMVRAIQAVGGGEAIFSPAIAQRLIAFFAAPRPAAPPRVFPELTDREREVLALLARGQKNPEIASRLSISLKTVRNHVSNIFSKLQVADRAQAILRAREAGLG